MSWMYIRQKSSSMHIYYPMTSSFGTMRRLANFLVARYTGTDIFGGAFDPDRMVQWLRDETEFALAEGVVRASPHHRDDVDAGESFLVPEKVLEYEYRSNKFFCHSKCVAPLPI